MYLDQLILCLMLNKEKNKLSWQWPTLQLATVTPNRKIIESMPFPDGRVGNSSQL